MTTPVRRKLIEVALPLEAINRESAREKSIRHGHPSTLHLWWARRPLAACRAVLFAQLVDDPSAHPDRFPTEEDQAKERQRLFALIERLVVWENTTGPGSDALMREAYEEIAACFDGDPPAILDPFAGGGSIPLEAQRLGLEAHASDLNPVAVLINKALIEIPPRWAGQPPVFPEAAASRSGDASSWPGATGLAEDVRRYGAWMRDEAEQRIGHLYPKAQLPGGGEATVIAWLWARTVTCPNPACGATMPLAKSFWLSKKKDRPTWLRPVVENGANGPDRQPRIRFEIATGAGGPALDGTVGRTGAVCLVCQTPVPLTHIRTEGKAGRMGAQMTAIVAEGHRQRIYLPATEAHIAAADVPKPDDVPDAELPHDPRAITTPNYGMTRWADLFTNRQLTALTTLSDLISEVCSRVVSDLGREPAALIRDMSYGGAVATYLGFANSRTADRGSTLTGWDSSPKMEALRNTFARQTVSMVWDFAEGNPFSASTGNFVDNVNAVSKVVTRLPARASGQAGQRDAATADVGETVVATDPPYYDNIGYADLSDFFYVWLRRSLRDVHGELMGTVVTPKAEELVAAPHRFDGDKKAAERFFETGFVKTFAAIASAHPADVPLTLFYAFKQAEITSSGTASTGWETMLSGLIDAGLMVTGTWPMRSELGNRMRNFESNALASSIVLACRPRPDTAEATTRRGLIQALHAELPTALRELQQGSIAPVDLAQAAIGPGMATFTRYATVLEADGSAMTVRTALALINQVLDEVLAEQEGDFDADTRFCVKWFSQYGWDQADAGTADTLSRATNTSVAGLERGGIFRARAGKAHLVAPADLPAGWDPATDERVSAWEVAVRLASSLATDGIDAAAALMAAAGQRVDLDTTKELAYLLYSACEKKRWTESALLFNGLGQSWADLIQAARQTSRATVQPTLDFAGEVEG